MRGHPASTSRKGSYFLLLPAEASLFRAAAGSISPCITDLGLVLSSPLLSRGFTACGREGSNINSAGQERSPLKTWTEWKDSLAWLGPAPCSQALTAFFSPSRDTSLKPCSTRGFCFQKKGSFCCTGCPGQGRENLWSESRRLPSWCTLAGGDWAAYSDVLSP